MPLPATWRSWLNWIGCSRATRACVTQGERLTSSNRPRRRGDEEHGAKNADLCDRVGAAMKDLRHRSMRRGWRDTYCVNDFASESIGGDGR